ncbi:MAG TPA: ABC transporter permease [Blastocatellia bacterium]|nr:ABC transporter permease [Blastocatellia bacterium]
MQPIWQDLRYGARMLLKSPTFTLIAVITLALGIGANTAVFSVANAVLLRPLPYQNPGRLVLVASEMRRRNITEYPLSNTDVIDLRNGAKATFEDIAAVYTLRRVMPREDGAPDQVRIAMVTPNFFRLLGAKIVAGRDFTEADGQPPQTSNAPGAQAPPTIAILSYEYWQKRYGGNTSVIGQAMLGGGNDRPQIVGVLAPGFDVLLPPRLNVERLPDVWYASRISYDINARNTPFHRTIARLKDGASIEQAKTEAEVVAAEIRKADSIREASDFHFRLEPMGEYLVAEVRPTILALTGAAVFLLLIACANVANLLLVRASLRRRELAVRAALGAGWARLARQLLVEALLIAGAGTLLGLGLAWLGIRQLLAIAPPNLPRLDTIRLDPVTLAYAALAGLAAAVIFGLPPALQASRPNVMNILRGSSRTSGLGSGRRISNIVVITEVALSFVLLIGSGLMMRSFIALQRIDPGYDPHGLISFRLLGLRGGQQPQEQAALVREIQGRLRALPGVENASACTSFPLSGYSNSMRWGPEQALSDPSKAQTADYQMVIPGYFEMMRMRLLAGRTFTETDNAPEQKVVIIDEFLAAKAFPNESAVGKRILIRLPTLESELAEVIGVVGHQRSASLAEPGREQLYVTDGRRGHGMVSFWAVRVNGDSSQAVARQAAAIRAEVARINPNLLITEMQPMDAMVKRAQAGTRFSLLLIGVFAVIAALLACVGLYGVLSTVVRQRTAEIGVRMALGATPGGVFKLVVGHGMRLSAIGVAIGLAAAFGLTRAMTGMLVGVKATDPATFLTMAALFLIIAAVASWAPARRASGLDPTIALREE